MTNEEKAEIVALAACAAYAMHAAGSSPRRTGMMFDIATRDRLPIVREKVLSHLDSAEPEPEPDVSED